MWPLHGQAHVGSCRASLLRTYCSDRPLWSTVPRSSLKGDHAFEAVAPKIGTASLCPAAAENSFLQLISWITRQLFLLIRIIRAYVWLWDMEISLIYFFNLCLFVFLSKLWSTLQLCGSCYKNNRYMNLQDTSNYFTLTLSKGFYVT